METPDDAREDDAIIRLKGMVGLPAPGDVYRHYKGGLYSVVAVSIKEDSGEILVTYHSNIRGTNWTRTLENFTEKVTHAGVPWPRFRKERD